MTKYIWLLFFIPSICSAESYLKYGLGILNSNKAETRHLAVGVRNQFVSVIDSQLEVGGWADRRTDLNRSSSAYGQYSLGVTVKNSVFYLQAFGGIAAITNTDAFLGGNFPQFVQDIGFGFNDDRGVKIGASFKHMSSAGIYNPNMGRDFLSLELSIPL